LTATAARSILFSFFKERERLRYSRSAKGARAAFYFGNAIRIFANKFAFWFRAAWFVAFPVAFGFFADRFALRFGSLVLLKNLIFVNFFLK
jgi:hypothetical protein